MKTSTFQLLFMSLLITSCGSNEGGEKPAIQSSLFGTLPDGTEITSYTLTNSGGIEMKVITYGAIITSLKVPDKEGNAEDIVLGYDNLEGYLESSPYFGAVIGRYGNRIANGSFMLDSQQYKLATNNGPNHLHGGEKGFDKVVWKAEEIEEEKGVGLLFTRRSLDMEEGYPGNLDVTVRYFLTHDNTLEFDYFGRTDKRTIVNLTQHSYFNLSAMEEDILNHELMINADIFLPVDSTLIPVGEQKPVADTPFDFTSPKPVGRDILKDHEQLKFGIGYDHCWVLNRDDNELSLAATLYEPRSGRFMEVQTTEPGIQFYSGNFLDGSITGKGNKVYNQRTGLCLETQHFPDSPNQPGFPGVVLNPGEEYRSRTVLKFTVK